MLRCFTSKFSHLHFRANCLEVVVEMSDECFMPCTADEHADEIIGRASSNRRIEQRNERRIRKRLSPSVLKVRIGLSHAIILIAHVVDVDGRPGVEVAPI